MAEKTYLEDFTYAFMPFSYDNQADFHSIAQTMEKGGLWSPAPNQIRYLHSYVTDKLLSSDKSEKGCYQFVLREEGAPSAGIYLKKPWYCISGQSWQGVPTRFCFEIGQVQAFLFSTGVGILAFRLHLEDRDLRRVAALQYYLRKVAKQKLDLPEGTGCEGRQATLVQMSEVLLEEIQTFGPKLFFYSTAGNERANFLTYADVPRRDGGYTEDLYFLKWCYHDGYFYDKTSDLADSENFYSTAEVQWGVSPSAAVCLVNRIDNNRDFVEKTLQKNFQREYLFTYVLLLHQKYTMYLFLTKLGVGMNNDLQRLEEYKRRLYEFETDFMFTCVSEVPQYQRLYSKAGEVFALDQMFRDVQEPIVRLAEIRQQQAQEVGKKRDDRLNRVLTALSLLAIFSAITDAAAITSELGWLLGEQWVKIIQLAALALVLGLSLWILVGLLWARKKR